MIPVIYLNLHPAVCHPRDHWDTSIFQELILKGYPEWNGKPEDWPKAAVVMIAGRFHYDDVDAINRTLGFLDGCVVVIHSDEESLFPWGELEHPNARLWVMTPDPALDGPHGSGPFETRFIGEGWSPGTPAFLSLPHERIRDLDVTFHGQVTHLRREACVDAIRRCEGHYSVRLGESTSFASGLPRFDYLAEMARTKFAPCPTGPVTADSFRIYEALEAGCIPILDGIDGKGRDATNLWYLFFGPQCPLPIIHDWAKLPTMVEVLIEDWETRAAMVQRWWTDTKIRWRDEMAEDVKAVS